MPFFIIDSIPGVRYETREAFALIDDMVRDGIAELAEFSVVERDQNCDVVGEPFGAPSEFGKAKTTAA